MTRLLLILVMMIFLFVPAVQAADSFESVACRSGAATYIQNTKELVIMSFELKGILQSKSNAEILNNVSEQCVGMLKRAGDQAIQSGFCRYMYPNGDINVIEWDGGANDGKWQFLFGTGKWENIKGSGTWKAHQRPKPIAEGTFQNCITITGAYELKKQ